MSNELGNGEWDKNYQPSGISKAEERALECFPYASREKFAFQQGYEQAEKDTKNALLEWAKDWTERYPYSQEFQMIINKLNSM